MDNQPTPTRRRTPRIAAGLGLLAAGAVAGSIFAGTITASAETTPSTPTPTPTATDSATPPAPGGTHPHRGASDHGGANPVRGDEKSLSTADADKVRAAALQAVPGGTVYRVETDAGDGAYEAHMTKSDGTLVTVKFDQNFVVTTIEDGMGKGDPAARGN